MKAVEQHSPLMVFIVLYKAVLTFEYKEIQSVTIRMEAIEQCFPVVLFCMLYNVILPK